VGCFVDPNQTTDDLRVMPIDAGSLGICDESAKEKCLQQAKARPGFTVQYFALTVDAVDADKCSCYLANSKEELRIPEIIIPSWSNSNGTETAYDFDKQRGRCVDADTNEYPQEGMTKLHSRLH
jgi:hypothetical protein